MECCGENVNFHTRPRPSRKRRRSDNGRRPMSMAAVSPLGWLVTELVIVALLALLFPAPGLRQRGVSCLVVPTRIRGRSKNHHHWSESSDESRVPKWQPRTGAVPPSMVASETSCDADTDTNAFDSSDSRAMLYDEATDTAISTGTKTTEAATAHSDLESLGWGPHFAEQLERGSDGDKQQRSLIPVRITEVRSKSIHVLGPGGMDRLIPLSKGQKIVNDNPEKVVVAGDWILVEEVPDAVGGDIILDGGEGSDDDDDPNGDSPGGLVAEARERPLRIHTILNRKSKIQRKAPGRKTRKKQLIAANLDTVFVVSSCNQDFNVARLERYIAMVLETERVAPVIVLTKKDLLEFDDEDLDLDDDDDDEHLELNHDDNEDDDNDNDFPGVSGAYDDEDGFDDADASSWLLDYYRSEAGSIAGGSIPVVCLDARDGPEASALLAPWLGVGQTVAFVGSSGVGKSTLLNSLCGSERAATGAIHADSGQGRHTTTRRQLHFLESPPDGDDLADDGDATVGCSVLDTPGLRELQLVETAQGLDLVFMDLVDLSKRCRFRDCTCRGEPGCAVDAALDRGEIDPDRVARWQKLVAEDAANTRDVAESARRTRGRPRRNRRAKENR